MSSPYRDANVKIGKVRFKALACDYDNTIALQGTVAESTKAALVRVRESGRAVLLVTGRTKAELIETLAPIEIFDRIVAENGATMIEPATGSEVMLCEPLPARFISELHQRGVAPLTMGRVICSTWYPHHTTLIEVIHDLGLDLQIIFNKGSVMVLPAEVSKATGMRYALDQLGISLEATCAVGDAENDLALMGAAGCGVAVANALDSVKHRAHLVTSAANGHGVEELSAALIRDDLRSLLAGAEKQVS